MNDPLDKKTELLNITESFQKKHDLSETVSDDYFEPGMMENLDQYMGVYDEENNQIRIRTEVKGLRYENRTQKINDMKVHDRVLIRRDEANQFNSNNFSVHKLNGEDIGNLPADLCNALAALYDKGYAQFESAEVSYIERLSERSRYARQGILFLEICIKLIGI